MVHADQYIDLKFLRGELIYGGRKTYIILGKFKIACFLVNKWKIHFCTPSSEPTQPAVVSIFKKSDKIHTFSDFFQQVFWFPLDTRKEGAFREETKCVIAEPALSGDTAEQMTRRQECKTLPLPEKSAAQAWLEMQLHQLVWLSIPRRYSRAVFSYARPSYQPFFQFAFTDYHHRDCCVRRAVGVEMRWLILTHQAGASPDLGLNSGDFRAEERLYCQERRIFQVLECHEQGKRRGGVSQRVRGGQDWLTHQVCCGEWRGLRLVRGWFNLNQKVISEGF